NPLRCARARPARRSDADPRARAAARHRSAARRRDRDDRDDGRDSRSHHHRRTDAARRSLPRDPSAVRPVSHPDRVQAARTADAHCPRRARTALLVTLPWSCSFAVVTFPTLTVLCVLDAYAEATPELVAELVAFLEVLVRARLLALGEERARLCRQIGRGLGALPEREAEHAVHVEEET